MGEEYSSFGRISMLYAVCLTSGLHGPRVRLIMPKHCIDACILMIQSATLLTAFSTIINTHKKR